MGRVYEFGPFRLETGGLVDKDDLTQAIWLDDADKENHLAHLDWPNNSTLAGLELLARRDDPAHSSLIGDAADLTEDTERVGACVQRSQL